MIKKLEEIKYSFPDILVYNENIYLDSKEEEVYNFLEKEILLNKKILEKFKDINGDKLKNLKENGLINLGLKLGERRKIIAYILSIRPKHEKMFIENITNNSTIEEVCLFLKQKFNLSEDIVNEFKINFIDGQEFLKLDLEKISEFDIDEEIQKEIVDYITSRNLDSSESEEEQIEKEEKYFQFQLIEIIEYLTSEEEYNKCPFNKIEGFSKLCNFMGVDNKENCAFIAFDQANTMKLKSSTLWGSKDALFEFFEEKKMNSVIEFFKNKNNDSSGIYLLIKEDKSFAYILIWPGEMKYFYRKLEEPQKNLLLSLVRMGFSLSDNIIICLSEKQKNEFDFQAISVFNSGDIYKATEGTIKSANSDDYFKLGEDLEIKNELNLDGKIKDFKLNNSSLFIHISTEEIKEYENYDKIPSNKINFELENIIIDPNFEFSGINLYNCFIKFNCLENLLQEEENLIIKKLCEQKIKQIQEIPNNLLKFINKIESKECEFCKTNFGTLYAYLSDDHDFQIAHERCFKKEKKDLGKQINLSDKNYIKDFIISFQDKYRIKDYQTLDKIFKKYLDNSIYRNYTYNTNNLFDFYNSLKSIIEKNEQKILEENKEYKEWTKNLIKKISEFTLSKNDNINICFIFEKATYDDKEKKYYYSYKKRIKKSSKEIIKLVNIYKYNDENYYLLKNNEEKKWDKKEYEFENYFYKEKNKGLLIKKKNDYYEVKLNRKKIRFNGGCDYYNNILIISNKDTFKKGENINIYYLDEDNTIIEDKGKYFDYIENISKIKIIPYYTDNSSKYVLLIHQNLISLININFEYLDNLDIEKQYKDYNLSLLQFLVYGNYLLIFFFDDNKKFWNYDVFKIEDNKLNKKENNKQSLNFISKEGKFAICNIKEVPILYFCYIENDKLEIKMKKILTSLSSIAFELYSHDNENLNLTEGNCVINYFYHSFIKYPFLGALQCNYYNIEKLKNIYIFSKDLKKTKKFKNYFNELKRICVQERQYNFDDIKYEFQGIYKREKIKNYINLDDLIIRFIEVIPLQIAKIRNYYFKAMSNGKEIKLNELYEKLSKNKNDNNIQISIQEYSDFINFSMKNSIFNFYDLPVVVLAFMGVQSIGKSTLSNELVESFFNVSGMRCTEGIWMAISLFKGKETKNKCKEKCKYCQKKKCGLYNHNPDLECICDDCRCNEKCCLFVEEPNIRHNQNCCKKRCALYSGHNQKNNKKIIEESHICEISPYNHGFICVSLDFEGLGTFERSLEQDIDLAMVGAAISNSLILRADKTFDKFMQSRMFDWSEGSKNIKNIKNSKCYHYFGGNIIFCQKDVPRNSLEEVKHEFDEKMKKAIMEWEENQLKRTEKDSILNRNKVFGIFSKYFNSPSPMFNKAEFYGTLRKELIHLLVRNVLMIRSNPNYRTGTEFMSFLKTILSIVDIHDYNVLDNIAIDNLKKYLYDNEIKAIEIFGIYSKRLKKKKFDNVEQLEEYLNEDLENLRSSFISNSILSFNEIISIDISSPNLKIEKIGNIKFNNYIINIDIEENKFIQKTKEKSKSYTLNIKGIKEYGLLLLIPSEYKEQFGIENIRKNLFSLWKLICSHLNLSDFEINLNFRKFILTIIKRRNDNIKKWLSNLTSSFKEEKIESINEINAPLEERWKLCEEKCYRCYFSCTKLFGHAKEHDCEFDHKCHEKCQICEITNCENQRCDLVCKIPAGHGHLDDLPKSIMHSCSHPHHCEKNTQCQFKNLKGCTKECQLGYNHKEKNCYCKSIHICGENCCYKDYSIGCKIKCNLELNHELPHKCESEEHKCIRDCSLKNISKGCINNGKCNLKLPHLDGKCNCKGEHYCINDCYLKDLSRDCSIKCNKPYGHYGKCICGLLEKHKCKEYCDFKGKAKGCKEICILIYGHNEKESHNCGEKHFCLKDCSYTKLSRNCISDNKCILEYNHKGQCTCGGEHLCNKNCSINQCNNKCNLPYNHNEKDCDCKKFHICQKECSLLKFSTEDTCKGKCQLKYGHKGNCLCEVLPENHKFNKKDSFIDIKNNLCVVKECQYQYILGSCLKKCIKNFGHKGPHLLEEKKLFCNKECDYKKYTKIENGGCLGICKLPFGHEGSHFCSNSKESHKCAGICILKNESSEESCNIFCNKSIDHEPPCLCNLGIEKHICKGECQFKEIRGCKISCCLPTHHKKDIGEKCICSVGIDGHKCGKICSLFKETKNGCKGLCNLKYNHDGPCFCSLKKEDHKCKKQCSLKEKTRVGCSNDCKFNAGHPGPCLCQNLEKDHICNGKCSLKDESREESCYDICNLNAGHNGNHVCCSKKHICGKDCDYKHNSRFGCNGGCSKDAGHSDKEHKCIYELNKHKCKEKCHMYDNSRFGCNHYCNNIPGHNGLHLCDSNNKHLCKEICFLTNICHKGNIKYCSKNADHKDEHSCQNDNEHKCDKLCEFENKSRGCKIECSLLYNHESKCICSIPKNKHFCLEKCELCKGEVYCEFQYGHSGNHLCKREHYCEALCEQQGYCVIGTKKVCIKKNMELKNKEIIEYEESSQQECTRLKCSVRISPEKIDHKHKCKHKCQISTHKCGFKCKQCERMCDLEYGHKALHNCYHGHISNANIFTKEKDVKLNYQNKEYDFQNDESAYMFTCNKYCNEQGRGHIHIIGKSNLEKVGNLKSFIKKEYIKLGKENLYECKCEFFWKFYLKFEFDEIFDSNQKKLFNKCPAICPLCIENKEKIYCELDLWHEPKTDSFNYKRKYWISHEGHQFYCHHPVPCHTIFIIDKSGSMSRNDITPVIPSISSNEYFNNRMGKLIENMDKYVNRRNKKNKEDIFSFITFSDKADVIFSNINCNSNKNFNLINESMEKIGKCEGETEFYLGFKEAEKILSNINRKKYKPVIILFSDGADQKPEETFKIVNRVSIYFI